MNTQPNATVPVRRSLTQRLLLQGFPAFLLALILITTGGCTGGDDRQEDTPDAALVRTSEAGEDEGEGEEEESNEVTLSAEQVEAAGIEIEAVGEQEVNGTLAAPARIVPTETATAEVGSLVAGRVTRLFVRDGSSVQRGDPMAEIESLEIGRLKGDYLRAHAAVEQTRAAFERQQQLEREEIGAQRTLEEARAAFHSAQADLTALATQLAALGIDPQTLEEAEGALGAHIVVRAPIAGIVARREVALGAFVEPSRDLFEIVNPGAVYADAQVPPDVAATLERGGTARVRTADGQVYRGTVAAIAPTVDPESRTVSVRISMENSSGLRPETYADAEFDAGVAERALAVPVAALEREGEQAYVYRELTPNAFERVPVRLGTQTTDYAIVLAGLSVGDRIAMDGVFYLKSARQKGELGDDD
ncbi:MAG: efflux RND transporter periplasmic adaptor subunit [Alphaproteobacteria bacterium]